SLGVVAVSNPRFSPIDRGGLTPPTITYQPQSQTVTAGGNASFTVAASGSTPFTYQWRKNGTPISTATNVTLVLLNVQAAAEATYSITVANSAGTITSAGATLTVNPALSPLAT